MTFNLVDSIIISITFLLIFICVLVLGIFSVKLYQNVFEVDCSNTPITGNINSISRSSYE